MEWLPPCCDMSRLGDRQASRRVDGSPLREEEQEEDGAYPHLSPCPPLEIHFHSSFFIYASSPVERSGILELSKPEWEVRLYVPRCAFRSERMAFMGRRLVVDPERERHVGSISEGRAQSRVQTGRLLPRQARRVLQNFCVPVYEKKSYGNIIISWHLWNLWILWELKIRHWSKSVPTLCPPYPAPSIQSNTICKIKQDVWRRMKYTYCRQQNHPFPSTLLTSWGDVRSNYLNRINNRHLQCFCCGWANWAFANISLSLCTTASIQMVLMLPGAQMFCLRTSCLRMNNIKISATASLFWTAQLDAGRFWIPYS